MRLDVHVQGRQVAQLYRDGDEYLLQYRQGVAAEDFVSLAMPVQDEPWRWPRDLHPFFRQNLPEGYLLDVIRETFGPLMDGTDLSLLAVVGASGIGRVAVTAEGGKPGVEVDAISIDDLLTTEHNAEQFGDLVRQYARSGISGVVPKFIAPEASGEQPGKATLRTPRHIIKGSDGHTPYLGFNEFYSMRVLERLNVVPVAKARMSDDGQVLVVDRFDIDAEGHPTYGLEDACSLLGLPPHEKYLPTTERVLHATEAYVPPELRRGQHVHFGWQLLINYVVRNADCHSKNIALYYSSRGDVAYSPVFDVVTTQAYPRYVNNGPGLSVGGRKTWAPGKALQQFFASRLGISSKEYASMVERLCESAVEVGKEIVSAATNEPRWTWVATQMLHAWNDGMCTLRSAKQDKQYRCLDDTIKASGFGPPDAAEKRGAIGRSDLLAVEKAP
ncbi:type II toxin-antitoxin system HipA family toxin [Bordetella genomosp. 13]|uniref:type II toxin-antitoxin system HipA family toxin n=1 Tax=Bordetella genomosp. 13 TaxID=463040 RepID=UPI0011A4CB80|nr:type II toxin-antitoxin system HipA family toxin [Bordetella genomosp. 13]